MISTRHATPGFKAPMTATCAASTASCTKIWSGVKSEEMGKLHVMSLA